MKQSFQVLSEKLLDRILEVDKHQSRVKSGMSPGAQSPKLLQAQGSRLPVPSISEYQFELIRKKSQRLYYLIEFMLASGCRISEALAVNPIDINSLGMVKLKAKKGSKSRIVHPGKSIQFLLECRQKGEYPWSHFSRYFVYRNFKAVGINFKFNDNTNSSVTHAIRHIVAQSNKNAGFEIESTQYQLGHKSINSTKHYHDRTEERK